MFLINWPRLQSHIRAYLQPARNARLRRFNGTRPPPAPEPLPDVAQEAHRVGSRFLEFAAKVAELAPNPTLALVGDENAAERIERQRRVGAALAAWAAVERADTAKADAHQMLVLLKVAEIRMDQAEALRAA